MRKMIIGEAMALRAFLHFDMLRLFGPVYVKEPSAEAIPYNESDKVSALPILSADTVMGRVLRDIQFRQPPFYRLLRLWRKY